MKTVLNLFYRIHCLNNLVQDLPLTVTLVFDNVWNEDIFDSLEENSDKFNFLITQVAEIDGKRPKKPVSNEGQTNVNNNKLELR